MTAGASALLVVIGGGAAGVAALTRSEPRIVTAVGSDVHPPAPAEQSPSRNTGIGLGPGALDPGQPVGDPAGRKPLAPADPGYPAYPADQPADQRLLDPVQRRRAADGADRTGTRPPRTQQAMPAAPQAGTPVTTRTETETRAIPYRTRLIRDPGLRRGDQRVQTEGVAGEETLRWQVTYRDGRQVDRRLLDSVVTRQPQHRVVAFGGRGRGGWGQGGWGQGGRGQGGRGQGGWGHGGRGDRGGWGNRNRHCRDRGGDRQREKDPNGIHLNSSLVC